MSFADFSLVPADDPQTAPGDDLAAATASALGVSPISPVAPTAVLPLGVSWLFDFRRGEFVQEGISPAPTREFDTLGQWCEMAVHSARYAHAVFSDGFGMEAPDGLIGQLGSAEAQADWTAALVDALMVHDRVSSVENVSVDWDPTTGTLTILTLDVITDTDETLNLSDVTMRAGGGQ